MGNRDHIGVQEFKKINWLPTKERFEQCVLVNIYKFFNKRAPEYVAEMYYPVEQGQKTRFSFQKLILPHRTTNRGICLSYVGPRLWNGLQTEIKSVSNANNFKHEIKNNFLINSKRKKITDIFITKN